MIRGLYTSATGMVTQAKILDTITNNLANSDSTAYKKDIIVTSSFKDILTKKIEKRAGKDIGTMSSGVQGDFTYIDFTQGSLKQTTNNLDFAIKGDGFFVIKDVDKEGNSVDRYTRNGSFVLNENNMLVTNEGKPVLDENNNPIYITDKDIYIVDNNGMLFANNKKIAKLKVVDFDNKLLLKKIGNGLFEATTEATQKEFTGELIQGYIETSNVNIIKEMVDMINVSRNYETNQKLLQIHDQMLSKSVNEVGKI